MKEILGSDLDIWDLIKPAKEDEEDEEDEEEEEGESSDGSESQMRDHPRPGPARIIPPKAPKQVELDSQTGELLLDLTFDRLMA